MAWRSLREATTRRGSLPSARLRFSVTSSFEGSAIATSGTPSSKPTGSAANMCAFSAGSRDVALGWCAKPESSTKRRPFWSASRRPRSRSSSRPLSSRTSPRRLPERTPSWSASSSCSSVSRPARKISVPSGTPRLATSSGVVTGGADTGGADSSGCSGRNGSCAGSTGRGWTSSKGCMGAGGETDSGAADCSSPECGNGDGKPLDLNQDISPFLSSCGSIHRGRQAPATRSIGRVARRAIAH